MNNICEWICKLEHTFGHDEKVMDSIHNVPTKSILLRKYEWSSDRIYQVCWVGYLSNLHHRGESEAEIFYVHKEWKMI